MEDKIRKALEESTNYQTNEIDTEIAVNKLLDLFSVSSSFQGYCKEETLNGKRCGDICDKPQCGW